MSPDRSLIASSVATACTESAGTVQALAEEVGVSYAALCSWSRGRRRPPAHRLQKLADVLDDRAERLTAIAQQLREQAGAASPQGSARSGGASPDARTDNVQQLHRTERPAMAASPQQDAERRGAGEPDSQAPGTRGWRPGAARYEPRRERPGSIPLPPPSSR